MRKLISVPMITLCLLLSGCSAGKEQVSAEDLRKPYLEAEGCTMAARISCDWDGLLWEGTVKCDYIPGGDSVVEVIEPEILAGVKAIVGEDFSLSYEDTVLNIAPITPEEMTPADCLPRLMDALREGWLLEENKEVWQETDCIRMTVDQSGEQRKIFSTFWLRTADALPLRAEVLVEEKTIFTVEFTEFAFCDMMNCQEETGK